MSIISEVIDSTRAIIQGMSVTLSYIPKRKQTVEYPEDPVTVQPRYRGQHLLHVDELGRGIAWLDTGTHDSLMQASNFIQTIEQRQGLKIACLEEIAYRKGYISAKQLRELAQPLSKNEYGQHLLRLLS